MTPEPDATPDTEVFGVTGGGGGGATGVWWIVTADTFGGTPMQQSPGGTSDYLRSDGTWAPFP